MCELCEILKATNAQESERERMKAWGDIDRLARGDLEAWPDIAEIPQPGQDKCRAAMIVTRAATILASLEGTGISDQLLKLAEVAAMGEATVMMAALLGVDPSQITPVKL